MKDSSEPIRILQILPGGHIVGGIENFVMNYYRSIDRRKVQFDFLVHYKERGYYDDEIEKMGGRIYYASVREDKNLIKYIKFLNEFFKTHSEYKIVHGHMPGLAPVYFSIAKKHGIKCRISHAHVSDTERTIKGRLLKIIIPRIKKYSNIYFACSELAGKFMYGEDSFVIIPNAIEIKKYEFNKQMREKLRKKYSIGDDFVIGCVGRFAQQKNHVFLIKVFAEVLKQKNNAKLVLIGDGPLKDLIVNEARRLEVLDRIIIIDPKNDISDYYNMFDCFVLSTNFEGLGLVLVEAQVNDLPVVTSDVVPKEAKISERFSFVSLRKSFDYWAKTIVNYSEAREAKVDKDKEQMYDIEKEARRLEKTYLELIR